MSTGVLLGRDHVEIGRIATIAEGSVSVALSRGGAAKSYHHRDPNEDAVGFRRGPAGSVLVAADGHGGTDAAELAVDRVLSSLGDAWTAEGAPDADRAWDAVARGLIAEIHDAILGSVAQGGNAQARTTLAFAVVRPGDGTVWWASVGDSHVFRAAEREAIELTGGEEEGPLYLGSPQHPSSALAESTQTGRESLGDSRAVVLCSDGLSERGIGVEVPEAAVHEAIDQAQRHAHDLCPLEAARGLVELALAAHRRHRAGDNVAAAVHWL
jgi:serine/threonine protein phosphatase PrpC